MDKTFIITEDNLIGSIARFILQLQRIKKGNAAADISLLDKLIEFIDKAKDDNYQNLLFDKHFIVSEQVLSNIHHELSVNNISQRVDFKKLKELLLEIPTKPDSDKIDISMSKLKELAMVLLQVKNQS